MAFTIKIPVKVKISPPKEKGVECLCPIMCLGCGTDTSLRSYDSTVQKKKPPLTLSGTMSITRAKGNFKLCESCRQRVENDYNNKIKKRRILRIVSILLGLAVIPLAIILQIVLFPSFPVMAPIGYSYLMIYWGVALSLIILFLGLAGAINDSKKELEDRIQRYPFRAFVDVTIKGDIILSTESYATQFREKNPDLKVRLKPGLYVPGIRPDGAIFYLIFTVLIIFSIVGVVFTFV